MERKLTYRLRDQLKIAAYRLATGCLPALRLGGCCQRHRLEQRHPVAEVFILLSHRIHDEIVTVLDVLLQAHHASHRKRRPRPRETSSGEHETERSSRRPYLSPSCLAAFTFALATPDSVNTRFRNGTLGSLDRSRQAPNETAKRKVQKSCHTPNPGRVVLD